MKRKYFFIAMSVLAVSSAFAQDYYDDDIYYDASKEKKPVKVEATPDAYIYPDKAVDFNEPVYEAYNAGLRDVDEYNRRGGIYAVRDSVPTDSVSAVDSDVFQYTERLERFDNPSIVVLSGDDRLQELYYANDVNIYIGTPTTFVSPFAAPYVSWNSWYGWDYGWTWGYTPYYYRPYYSWGYYDPYWYSPYYSWNWCWGYPYHHHHHHYHYYDYHPHHWDYAWHSPRRYNDGGSRSYGGNRSGISSRRPSSGSMASHGSGSFGSNSRISNGRRPSSSAYSSSRRPTTPSGSYSGSSSRRPTTPSGSYSGSSSRRSSSDYNNSNRNDYNRNSNSYNGNRGGSNRSNSGSYRSSGGSSRGGSSSYGGSRGGSSSRGGGGSRGGRR
ncbi:MAG: hypothetical protein PUE39_05825 [bacterium]|nr:hypothetical protein [bacterium]